MPAWTIEGALRAVARRDPVVVSPGLPFRLLLADVLPQLETRGGDAIVVVDPDSQLPLGVLTPLSLLRQLGLDEMSTDLPVAALMTAGVCTVSADAPVQQAATLMVRRQVKHLVLVESDGRFAGLVAQSDLYSMHAAQVDSLVRLICAAPDIETLSGKALEVRTLAGRMLNSGVSADAVCHWLSTLNDLIVLQVIDLIEPEFDLPVVPWCWLLFGSEGRFEQTIFTDQDNGILFVPEPGDGVSVEEETERVRQQFLPFALAVNQALDRCGFPLCSGQIMASNPKWCLSLEEWQGDFRNWLRAPEPEALLNASIFFDFRCLYGPEEPAQRLRNTLNNEAAAQPLCLRLMAANAIGIEPPLGKWWSAFRFDDPAYPETIDLKKFGSRLFVDAARVMALGVGVTATGTIPRLRELVDRQALLPEELSGFVDAFYHLQRLRLRHQNGLKNPDVNIENRVAPADLTEIDRQLLREAFQQAKRLQQRLRTRWSLE